MVYTFIDWDSCVYLLFFFLRASVRVRDARVGVFFMSGQYGQCGEWDTKTKENTHGWLQCMLVLAVGSVELLLAVTGVRGFSSFFLFGCIYHGTKL